MVRTSWWRNTRCTTSWRTKTLEKNRKQHEITGKIQFQILGSRLPVTCSIYIQICCFVFIMINLLISLHPYWREYAGIARQRTALRQLPKIRLIHWSKLKAQLQHGNPDHSSVMILRFWDGFAEMIFLLRRIQTAKKWIMFHSWAKL